jgi:hypothetical protein
MRITVTLDDDVTAPINHERERTGESFRHAVNRLIRTGGQLHSAVAPPLPTLQGAPVLDIDDVSAVLAELH